MDFRPRAIHLLVDRMKKNPHVAAACGRIKPLGTGNSVWLDHRAGSGSKNEYCGCVNYISMLLCRAVPFPSVAFVVEVAGCWVEGDL